MSILDSPNIHYITRSDVIKYYPSYQMLNTNVIVTEDAVRVYFSDGYLNIVNPDGSISFYQS